ncbi:MAG TPA: DUF4845 domain-containing protein [Denitromonas sp.]|uniref:DUF4845 domain-containing protein n=1 Tax=Denitromonas sp. TaxID=2734609 RepID=UPI001D54A6A8|nr:DUF4845 domain-containing protein [Rhodocyclaceae bacterium]MCP5220351.1 DUF4845 domain-containing protein [Zoogloeaceae bacterium]HPR08046.1 DUF4845 domain-containing protein [Denitromonas sp.]HQU87267.1 DUF4845 domain-containing protein [Denitromonas sp.]HQV13476.1 DUF4845 domain-containing protein [Denitromonas sp.]
MKNKQTGLSLMGVLILGAILGFLFLIGMRTVPVVTEYMAVKRVLNAMIDANPSPEVPVSQLRSDFDKRAYIGDVKSVSGRDLLIIKRGNKFEMSVSYSRKVPIAGNVSLLIEFDTGVLRGGS